jgi:Pyridine nucleotide-disulphide oxidoreductase, dimerisation domain
VTDRIPLTPIAIREGHASADTVFGGKPTAVDHVNVATAVFTTPEVGTVDLSDGETRAAYDRVDIYEASFRPLKATLSGRAEKTCMKIADAETDIVRRAHIFGEGGRRDRPASGHRHQASREKGGFRRDGRGASDLGRGAGHHAHAHGPLRAGDAPGPEAPDAAVMEAYGGRLKLMAPGPIEARRHKKNSSSPAP